MKYVLVTGACGGMGSATVDMLASKGYGVFALDKRLCPLQRENVFPVCSDVTDGNSVAKAAEEVRKVTDKLFAVVHFAGIYMLDSLVEIAEKDFRKILDINLVGAYLVNKTFVPFLSDGGKIVITTSELAPLDPLPFTGLYAVTKAALDKYAYSLAMELQLKNICVSVLRAGAVKTDMLGVSTSALDKFCQKTEMYVCNAERFKQIVDSVEAKSVPPQKIAEKVCEILSKRKPSFVYSVNRNVLLLMLNMLPKRTQLWAIKRVLKTK